MAILFTLTLPPHHQSLLRIGNQDYTIDSAVRAERYNNSGSTCELGAIVSGDCREKLEMYKI